MTSLLLAPVSVSASLPCRDLARSGLFFSESPQELAVAKQLCGQCPFRRECLSGALERGEPWGVWGGEIFSEGKIVSVKRGRGRPRKQPPPIFDSAA